MQLVKISQVKSNPNNPRVIKDDKFAKLVKSLQDFPDMAKVRPIVCNADMIVLGGNMRLKAMKEAGWKEVPVEVVDWDEEKQREFIIKDNVGFGEWDWEMIANEWDAEKVTDWGLDMPDLGEDKDILLESKEDEFTVPLGGSDTDIVPGDLIEIGEHRLICGSSTETDTWEKLMQGALADLIVTDPPYNVDYQGGTGMKIQNDNMSDSAFYAFLYDAFTAAWAYTKAGGAWYVWHADSEGLNFRRAFEDSGMQLKQCLIWVKNALVMGRQDYQWKHEPCLYGWKEGAAHYFVDERSHTTVIEEDRADFRKMTKKQLIDLLEEANSDRQSTTIIRCDKPLKNDVHPTMKPIKLLGPLIKNSSKTGQIVCDGFLGSGSTMVAAHQLKRKCYGIELDPRYCQVIIDRMRKLDPSLVIKKNGVEV